MTRTARLEETMDKLVNKYFEARKLTESLGGEMLHNDDFLPPIASFVQTKTIIAVFGQNKVRVFETTSLASRATEDTVLAAKSNFM